VGLGRNEVGDSTGTPNPTTENTAHMPKQGCLKIAGHCDCQQIEPTLRFNATLLMEFFSCGSQGYK
jgi:hypothetical protein